MLRRMRYLDTGSRDASHALGTWLDEVLLREASVIAVRVQTGFFGSDALGYFEPPLRRLRKADGIVRFLIGSNDGQTRRSGLEDLVRIAGPPRAGLDLGVVSFASGFFHPKVFHFERADGSATAYVGSGNLTRAGVTSKHVEAAIIVDTQDDDDPALLVSVADAIDAWFSDTPAGFYPFAVPADLDALVQAKIIDVTPPPRPARTPSAPTSGKAKGAITASLVPLVQPPSLTKSGASKVLPPLAAIVVPPALPHPAPTVVNRWSKTLSASDAQRKGAGNQRGAVTLVQGDYRGQIDQRTFFRKVLFQCAHWSADKTATGKPMDSATIAMDTMIDGTNMGPLDFHVTYAPNRESAQNNYTSTLHLEPLTPLFQQHDMSGRKLVIEALSNGTYRLDIS